MAKKTKNEIKAGGYINQPAGGNTIILMQPKRWNVDIEEYMRSVTEAERVDYPSRVKLYDLYDTILLDTHLSSVIDKRHSALLSSELAFMRNGKQDDSIKPLLDSPWFYDFLEDVLSTIDWGFSLFQFKYDSDGWLTYNLIPRKHVEPIRRLIFRQQSDVTGGMPFEDFDNLLFVGKPRALGELIRDIPWALYKRGDIGDWAQFCELFGQPIREYVYTTGDEDARYQLMQDIMQGGGSSVYLHPDQSNLTLHDVSSKSGTSDLYKSLAAFCNAEMSKHWLGNTLTTETGDKGTQALGTVQAKVEERLIARDKRFLLNVLNYQMTDLLKSFGFNVDGGEFTFLSPKDMDMSKRADVLVKLSSVGVPLDYDQIYEDFGLNKPKDFDKRIKTDKPVEEKNPIVPKEEKKNELNTDGRFRWIKDFFGKAPNSRGAALDW